MFRFFLCLLFHLSSLISVFCGVPFIDTYSTLNYEPVSFRKKRLADGSFDPLRLRFASLNRTFHLSLLPVNDSSDPFDSNLIFDVDGVQEDFNHRALLFTGFDENYDNSVAYGSIIDGVFDGHIHYADGLSYSIERITRYFPPTKESSKIHSIIYEDKSINHPAVRSKRSLDDVSPGCALNGNIRQKMEEIQRSAVVEVSEERGGSYFRRYIVDREKRYSDATKTINGRQIYSVRACYIYLQADQKLYRHIFEKEGNNDHVRTREEIASLFYNHVKAVNQIYEATNFRGIQGINFVIQRISIYTQDSCINGKSKPGFDNPFCEENVDVSNYLNLNSRKNHSAFCLAYAFTFRDFVGGTLGLAWVASPNHNTAGGICQQYTKYSEGSSFVHRSLNTGIITLVNYGNRVPTRVSQLTLAHEIGHNFGSPHDFPLDCQPGLPEGNFIMFASATSGDKSNNARFSRCSIANISLVLAEVLQQRPVTAESMSRGGGFGIGKRNCFRETKSAFCGNQVKEPGEECDCGFTDTDCNTMNDMCCQAREERSIAVQNGCKRKPNAQCSPSEGPCCNANRCAFHSVSENKVCRAESECLEAQKCNGFGAECPNSKPKADGLPCQDSTKVCDGGTCNGSVCVHVGLKDCFLTEGKPEDLCYLACELPDKTCVSSLKLPQFRAGVFNQSGRLTLPGLILLPGSPCNNYKGYCDIFRKCRSVDADGPLARLKNVIFNPRTLHEVRYWIQENWWMVSVGGFCLLVFLAVFIKCCAVHTPSTNPNKPPALSIYDTLRRPRTLIRRPRNGRPVIQDRPAPSGVTSGARRQNARSHNGGVSRVGAQPFRPVPASAPPPPPQVAAPPPPSRIAVPSTSVIIEPPPPYSASADPGAALGGPRRGHRQNKKRPEMELRVKNRKK